MSNSNAWVIESLIGKGRSCGIGERLVNEYKTMQAIVQNIDNLPITNKQKETLRSALAFRCIAEEPESVNSPSDAAALCKYLEAEKQEHLIVIGLDRRSRVVYQEMVYKGNLYSSMVRAAEVFRTAIIRGVSAIILVHNHPTGDSKPSPDDVALTRALVQAGKLFDIEVQDHLVIGFGNFTSLKERGLGFS